jgi:ParB-like chromosome segregation protein Spo0J
MNAGYPAEQLQSSEMDQGHNNEVAQDQLDQPQGADLAPATEPQTPPSEESLQQSSAPSDCVSDDYLLHLKFHPLTELFPPLEDKQYQDLKEDIRKHGQLVAILTYDHLIIDGRSRFIACEELDIKPVLQEWTGEGSLIALVLSLNCHRRHLNTSQRAMVAAKAKELFVEEAKQRMLAGKASNPTPGAEEGISGEAAAQAAKLLGVGRTSVYQAQNVRKDGVPELQEAVNKGKVTLTTAADLAALPREEQADTLAAGKEAVARTVKGVREKKSQAKKGSRGKGTSKSPVRAAETISDSGDSVLTIDLGDDDQKIVERLVEGLGADRAKAVCETLRARLQIAA